jgi:hypothetical protein
MRDEKYFVQTTKAYGYTYEAKEYKTVEAWGWLKRIKKNI